MQNYDVDVLTLSTIPLSLKTVLDWELENRSAREAAHDHAWKRWAADADSVLVDCIADCWFAESTILGDVLFVTLRAEKGGMTGERTE